MFPQTVIVTDRFHVQKLASEAAQEERMRLRQEIIELENKTIEKTRKNGNIDKPELLSNGATLIKKRLEIIEPFIYVYFLKTETVNSTLSE